jgi:ubiquinone/menaquinone biosynthesis C-methylase UbiE
MKTEWDYSDRAQTYDQRADYNHELVGSLIQELNLIQNDKVADIGAGTGKLTKLLLENDLVVFAVEPNDSMRKIGISNLQDKKVTWSEGIGEESGLASNSVKAVFFGSSFNVVNQEAALKESARILQPGGYFACMWNHRDTTDPVQREIEDIIVRSIPSYDYGLRRQDPSETILKSNLFGEVRKMERKFFVKMSRDVIVDAWRSHETLYRQAGDNFEEIIQRIQGSLIHEEYLIPYFTRIWYSQKIEH